MFDRCNFGGHNKGYKVGRNLGWFRLIYTTSIIANLKQLCYIVDKDIRKADNPSGKEKT